MSTSPSMSLGGDEADSVTSTIEEEPDSDQEWLVNDVLAEGVVDGTTKYLIDWQGYPLYDASWEPKENLGDVMLADWEESKKKEGHQRKSNESIEAWRKAVVARLYGKIARHNERNRKRAERGLEESVYEKSLEDYLEDLEKDPKGEEEIDDQKITAPSSKSPPLHQLEREPSGNTQQRQVANSKGQSPKKAPTKLPNRGASGPEAGRRHSGTTTSVREAAPKQVMKSTLRSKLGPYKPKEPPKGAKGLKGPKGPGSETNSSQLVVREASTGNTNVFAGGKVTKKRPTLLDAAMDPTKKPQLLNHRLTRKIEKGLRDKEGTTVPVKQLHHVFSLNPKERELADEEAASELDPIPSSAREEIQSEGSLHQPSSNSHTLGEPEKGSSTAAKKKKKSPFRPNNNLFGPKRKTVSIPQCSQNYFLPPPATTVSPTAIGGMHPDTASTTRNAKFGPSATVSIPLTFEGTPGESIQHWASMLKGSETLVFTHTCTAQDFWSQAALQPPLFRGIVTSCNNLTHLTATSERLKVGSFGILCHLDKACILLHPSNCEEWKDPNQSDSTTSLKFIIFEAPNFLEASSLAPTSLPLNHDGEDLPPVLELGTAILVTPSFLVSQPQQACVLLNWIWRSSKGSIDRYQRARLVVCAGIDDWLHELAIEGVKKQRSNSPTRDQKQEAIHREVIEDMFKTWQIMTKLINEPEEPGQLILAPESIDGNDEQSLVNWFGWWSIMNMDQFRRFVVLGSSDAGPRRLSRHIKRPRFLRSITNNPDEKYMKHDREKRLKYPTAQQGTIGQPGPDQPTSLRPSLNNQSRTLVDLLDSVINRVGKWCPIELYKFPVCYWNPDMAYHFGDYQSLFTTYAKCFNWLTPFEKLNFAQRNTMTALFYTIEGPWDRELYPKGSMPARRPWLVMHRPVNVHKRPWHASELLIWDSTPNEKFSRGEVYVDDLIEAQREMIRFYDEQNILKNPNQPIMKVWIAGFNIPPSEVTADPLDLTLSYLDRFAQDPKYWLPAPDNALPMRGWKMVKPGSAPASSSLDPMDLDEPEDVEQEDGRETKTIFHPPRGINFPGSTKCQNRLYQHTMESLQRVRDDTEYHMEYTFRPTLAWYREQSIEGRGFEHITVVPWPVIFRRYHLPDPEAE
ncbi:hypothetical protein G7Z17_g10474 [Cylindrodendrum hubeiense]|uniref:Chromo domain-containing protein n=1 Tax=Cylindrodendrum hubeiense TaxID=595255 RepID=A0A9P5H733_9HYPO|nr:hypothetical protein G7Z17_g10474 [Cylindrodendrum hubeiense]